MKMSTTTRLAILMLLSVLLPAIGVMAEDSAHGFRLPDLNGRMQELDSYRGRIVVLNFWATWCRPCNEEMPELVEIQNRYAPYGVTVVAAAADPVGSKQNVLDFIARLELNFPVLLSLDEDTMTSFGFSGELPATALIDPEGRIVARYDGKQVEAGELSARIDALLTESAQLPAPRKKVAW
jgi:peroxiredoxin